MSEFYTSMSAMSTEMLTEYGSIWTIRRKVVDEYDPATNEPGEVVISEHQVVGLTENVETHDMKDGIVEFNDLRLIIEGSNVAPDVADTVISKEGEEYSVVAVKPVKPGDIVMFYYVFLR